MQNSEKRSAIREDATVRQATGPETLELTESESRNPPILQVNRGNSAPLPVQTRIAHYVITDTVGRGGFGVTYLARNEQIGSYVAIKEFFPRFLDAVRDENGTVRPAQESKTGAFERCRERFMKEARIAVKFKQANLIRVHDLFQLNNTVYMVMEFENRNTLSRMIYDGHYKSEDKLLEIFLPLCNALKTLHQAQFIHRDIKPDNILIRLDGSPVLLDFGAAREMLAESGQPMTVIYTPGYAPMEQYDQKTRQGPWTDIYSLAAVLYEIISGKPPVDAAARMMALSGGAADPLPSLLEGKQGNFSKSLRAVVMAGMAVLPEERPQSIEAWLDLLEQERMRNSFTVYMESSQEDDKGKILKIVDSLEFFDVFSHYEKVRILFQGSKILTCDIGTKMVKEGDPGNAFYMLLQGSAQVTTNDIAWPLAELKAGDLFGEVAFLTRSKRISNVSCVSQCVVLEIDIDVMERLGVSLREKLKDRITHFLILRLQDMNQKIFMLFRNMNKPMTRQLMED